MSDLINDETVLDRIEALLRRQEKWAYERRDDNVIFDAPLYKNIIGSSWKAMVIYNYGRFWIDGDAKNRKLHYDLSSLHGFLLCIFFAAVIFLFDILGGGLTHAGHESLFVFGWLYGMNMMLAWVRIPLMIRDAIRRP